jgi:hypothetical protein
MRRVFLVLLTVSLVLLGGCPVPEPVPKQPAEEIVREPAEEITQPVLAPVIEEPCEPEPAPEEPPVAQPVPEEPAEEITAVFSEIKGGLKLELSLPKVRFQPGETLRAALSLINTTAEAISFTTRTSQLFDIIMVGAGLPRELRWSGDKMFLTVITPHHIPAGEKLSRVLSWDIRLSPGHFYLSGLTVPLALNGEIPNGEGIWHRTTHLRIKVE